jgi:hypothetical protein
MKPVGDECGEDAEECSDDCLHVSNWALTSEENRTENWYAVDLSADGGVTHICEYGWCEELEYIRKLICH